ncbi:hypothetical protein G7Y89_g4130 [Cudoniella acicularis]|uniref:Uncharacterized protein n=1 Tax=Cudoniella acicularis TaxID=354080 RepID=A0A8H4RS72_9HELO|nr:hypothetical protein G7Y89_g4130 [Cudoniella acicularis]
MAREVDLRGLLTIQRLDYFTFCSSASHLLRRNARELRIYKSRPDYDLGHGLLFLLTILHRASEKAQHRLCFRRSDPFITSITSQVLFRLLGRDTSGAAEYSHLEAFGFFRKRIDALEGGDSEGGASEGGSSTSTPPSGEAGGSEGGADQEASNSESNEGEVGESDSPPMTTDPKPVTDSAVVAPLPAGLGPDEMILWNGLTDNPFPIGKTDQLILWTGKEAMLQLRVFEGALGKQNPGINCIDSFCANHETNWSPYMRAYNKANHGSYLNFADMGLVTAPGSKIPQITRWEVDTFQQAIPAG